MPLYWTVSIRDKRHFWVSDDGTTAYKLHAEDSPANPVAEIKRVRTAKADLLAHFGVGTVVRKSPYVPGDYHPRMFRVGHWPAAQDTHNREWLTSMQAVRNVLKWMEDVFRVLEPEPRNAKAYGHEIRQLLILACTEVESAWKSILRANGYPTPKNDRWTTIDYVKLLKPLRLTEWRVGLMYHPDFPIISPFQKWRAKNPSSSLPWYKAYNAVKHDRETLAHEATLVNMIHAAAAAFVLVFAQFGQFGYMHTFDKETDAFYVDRVPKWPFAERYLPPRMVPGQNWTPKNYKF